MIYCSRQVDRPANCCWRLRLMLPVLIVANLLIAMASSAHAYIEAPYTLGRAIQEATFVLTMRVEKVDKQRNLIVYRKMQDIKGVYPVEVIKHNIGQGGFSAREWQTIMAWADVGKLAVFFHNNSSSETCIDNYWYQTNTGGEWWTLTHAEPFFLRTFAGRPEKLATVVAAMVAGQEVVVPCMVDGDKNALQLRTAKIQRLKASLKIQDYDARRDFQGWGGEDFRTLAGMPPFSHLGGVGRVDPTARSIATADFDGDGKLDICLCGEGRTALLQNSGTMFAEVALPYNGPARAAEWRDYNGDSKPDLLLIAPSGPKLLTNLGGKFRDDSARLPAGYYSLRCGGWIDYDGDSRPDIIAADRFRGLRLLRNTSAAAGKDSDPLFADISDAALLGERGLGSQQPGDDLLIADLTGDGRADLLYNGGTGLVAINTPQGLVAAPPGVPFRKGDRATAGDFDGDKRLDLLITSADGRVRLLHNETQPAKGGEKTASVRLVDVTSHSGDLATAVHGAHCAQWIDFDGDGHLDLLVGCFLRPNGYFRGDGMGVFTDAGASIGFGQRVFNTAGLKLVDLNGDKALDLIMNNEGQESLVLLGRASIKGMQAAR